MCGRTTKNYTWEQIHALYQLARPAAIPNTQPSFNVCPTDSIDTVVVQEGQRQLLPMRWGLVPFWWSKPLKELRLAIFNARVQTVTTKPLFREPFRRRRCLLPMSGYYEWQDTAGWQAAMVFHGGRRLARAHGRSLWDEWKNGEMGERLKSCTIDYYRAEPLRRGNARPDARAPHAFAIRALAERRDGRR